MSAAAAPNIERFATREALMREAAQRLGDALAAGIEVRGRACAALSGGGTPEPAYALLAARALAWRHVTFALVDERFVPPDHPASNEAMLRRALAPALAAGATLAPLYTPAADADEAARRADAVYAPLPLDVALMGMGADGHAASWFAGAAGLEAALDPATARTVVALHAPQAQGEARRLSLTLAAVKRAGRVLLLTAGQDKRARLEAPEGAPVAALLAAIPNLEILWAP